MTLHFDDTSNGQTPVNNNCNYYQTDDFLASIDDKCAHSSFSILHLNARSLNKNYVPLFV